MPADWDPAQYRLFAEQRAQPFWDLADLIDASAGVDAVDLGCGDGELTIALAARLGTRSMLGVDSSPAMLAAAAAAEDEGFGANVRFEAGDISTWTAPATVDLVFSNAALQWVPRHTEVLRRWSAALRPGGQIAVQLPMNGHRPQHVVARELAESDRFRGAFGPDGPPVDPVATYVLEPEEYAETLHELGFVDQHVRVQVYPHVLPSSRHVVEWVKGTTLTRFRTRLDPATYDDFVAAYEARLLDVIGRHEPFFFPFRRVLLWGRLAA